MGVEILCSKTSNAAFRIWIPPAQWLHTTLPLGKPRLNKTQLRLNALFSSAGLLYFTSWNLPLLDATWQKKYYYKKSLKIRDIKILISSPLWDSRKGYGQQNAFPVHQQLPCAWAWCLIQTHTGLFKLHLPNVVKMAPGPAWHVSFVPEAKSKGAAYQGCCAKGHQVMLFPPAMQLLGSSGISHTTCNGILHLQHHGGS